MLLAELISGLDVTFIAGARGAGADAVRVCDVTEAADSAAPGSLFVARRGRRFDGRERAAQAVASGASVVLCDDADWAHTFVASTHGAEAAIVASDVPRVAAEIAERFYGRPSSKLKLIGVTGTNGKTTVTWVAHQMLNRVGVRAGLVGTVVIDDGMEVAPAEMTTPPAVELSRTLAMMVEAGCEAAVLEVSSHALDQSRVSALSFDVGVFTNLSGDHLDYHGDMETYAACKALLFEGLRPAALAVTNADDPASARMIERCPARELACGAGEAGAARVRILGSDAGGMRLALRGPFGVCEAQVGAVGEINALNALQAALAVWDVAGERMGGAERLAEALAESSWPPGRLEPVSAPGEALHVLVDYSHTDDALRRALAATRQITPAGARLWAVFGCGGERDTTKRARMGAAAMEGADRVIVTSDNPRGEDPERIIDAVMAGIPQAEHGRVEREADRERAILAAVHLASPGDVVLIAGKGHETTQVGVDAEGRPVTRPFDDRVVAAQGLTKRGVAVRRPRRAGRFGGGRGSSSRAAWAADEAGASAGADGSAV